MTPEDLKELESTYKKRVLHTEKVEEGGETRYKMTDVIGAANDFGVENLAAAGLIAGETSQVDIRKWPIGCLSADRTMPGYFE